MTATPKTLFYPVWVSNSGRVALRWGRPCDSPSEARQDGRAKADAGEATLAFVVEFSGGEKTPLSRFVYPERARKVIAHWEALWAATEGPADDH